MNFVIAAFNQNMNGRHVVKFMRRNIFTRNNKSPNFVIVSLIDTDNFEAAIRQQLNVLFDINVSVAVIAQIFITAGGIGVGGIFKVGYYVVRSNVANIGYVCRESRAVDADDCNEKRHRRKNFFMVNRLQIDKKRRLPQSEVVGAGGAKTIREIYSASVDFAASIKSSVVNLAILPFLMTMTPGKEVAPVWLGVVNESP